MKQEFYERLKEVIKECEGNPYKATRPQDFGNGYEGRISKENLWKWTDEEYDIMFNHADEETEKICDKSTLDCFVYCDRGGYMYLAIL